MKNNENGCHHYRYLDAPQDAPEHETLAVANTTAKIAPLLLATIISAPKIVPDILPRPSVVVPHMSSLDLGSFHFPSQAKHRRKLLAASEETGCVSAKGRGTSARKTTRALGRLD
ncbi:MAG: hypothetical protein K2Z81_19145 [Cyanobacteria bacterium]|nr:hypothetical protein [Cyanobacteriota bacterium]